MRRPPGRLDARSAQRQLSRAEFWHRSRRLGWLGSRLASLSSHHVPIRLLGAPGSRCEQPLDAYYATMESELGRNPGNLRRITRRPSTGSSSPVDRSSTSRGCRNRQRRRRMHGRVTRGGARAGSRRISPRQSARSSAGQDALELPPGRARAETLQEFEPAGERFDLLTSMASINHLNEVACIRLNEDKSARDTSLEIFTKLAELAKPGATLIAAADGPPQPLRRPRHPPSDRP